MFPRPGVEYVFQPGYQLASFKDTADYIRKNKHLPGIPSAADVQQKGLSLGDMQTKLLAKIEELTVHTIATDEHNARLEQDRELQERVTALETARGDK